MTQKIGSPIVHAIEEPVLIHLQCFEIMPQTEITKRLMHFSIFFLTFVLLCFQGHAAPAAQFDKSSTPTLALSSPKVQIQDHAVRAGLLYDLSTDTVVWNKNMHQAYPIASLTKMMVGLLAVEDIHAGKISWNTIIQVTPDATRVGGFMVGLTSGSSLSVAHLLKAALISSGNDAAYLLAKFLGGTERKFAHRMNRRAQQLGMESTRFSNATGMPAPNSRNDNHSSPSDLLILCKEILKHDELLRITRMSESSISQGGKIIRLRNHNRLLSIYEDVDGFKTGFTNNAKFCLAATSNKNGRRIIAIALGVDCKHVRNKFIANILSQSYVALGMGSLQPKTASTIAYKPKASHSGPGASTIHQVKKRDTLYGIAKLHGCSLAQLKSWNRLQGNKIKPGQKLHIYKKTRAIHASVSQPVGSTVIYYKVQPGDTLWAISQKYNKVSVDRLMRLNRIKRASDLKTGDTVKIVLDIG
ncbi:MAG: LysM peptidoglycan-binding domain-containing protein [Desulfobacterales bacterium]|nr:LysM peptidoglycan-binding domain-containing protein [Desulfobacterales bacterium]